MSRASEKSVALRYAALVKESAEGHRLLRRVNPSDFKYLEISASYESPRGTLWHNNLMKMDPKALDNPAQWNDATLERFADKVQRGRGNYITGVRVYGRTRDGTGVGGLVKIIDWTREDGLFTDRESERHLKQLERERQERQQAEEKARAEEQARRQREEARREEERLLEQGSVWSVAQTGYDLGGDDEDEYQSYVGSVEIFDSKADAIAYAKDIGRATVVKGTQMWNEPMGQVEEHDRPAWTRYYR
jgi:hypothetical protein